MRSLVNKELHWMIVDVHLEDEVGKCAGLDLAPHDAVVVGVDQGLVQVEDEDFFPDHAQPVSGDGGECRNIILHSAVLLHLSTEISK